MELLSVIEGIQGTDIRNFGQGAVVALLAIVMVFAILALIIVITYAVGKIVEKFNKSSDETCEESTNLQDKSTPSQKVEITDDDMMTAVLVASIDYQNEIKQDVKVVSVKEI